MKKRLVALTIIFAMVLGLSACSNSNSPSSSDAASDTTPATSASSEASQTASPSSNEWSPTKSIKAVIGYAAGGSTDSIMRPLFSVAESIIGQTIVVENTAGGSGSISFNDGMMAAADGYTLIIGAETPALYDAYDLIEYTYNDVIPILVSAENANYVFVAADSPYQTIEEMFNAELANPGSVLKVASGTVGVNATVSAIFKHIVGVDFEAYTADSASSAVVTVMGGFADYGLGAMSTVQDYVANGDVRILCSLSPERLQDDIPTICEYYPEMADYLPINAFYTICVRADTDQAVVDYYTEVFLEAWNSKEYQEVLTNLGLIPLGAVGDEAREYVDGFRERALTVLTSTGAVEYTMQELGY